MSFKEKIGFQERRAKFDKISLQYPRMVPLVIERRKKSQLPALAKPNMLVQGKLIAKQLEMILTKKLCLTGKQSIYLTLYDNSSKVTRFIKQEPMQRLYADFKDEDGMLYIEYHGNETFGE